MENLLVNLLASGLSWQINWDDVLKALEILWKGMLAIAIVIGIIIVITMFLNKADDMISKYQSAVKNKDSDDKGQN